MVSDELGQVLQQAGGTGAAVFTSETVIDKLTDGGVKPGADGVHDDGGLVVVGDLGDHHPVAALAAGRR